MSIRCEQWGYVGGVGVDLYTLTNQHGMEVSISTYGGAITRLLVSGSCGARADVVLGYDTLDEYLHDDCYFGCIVGRVANRIGGARFVLDGVEYVLDCNHGDHQLHGGAGGFNTRVWQAEVSEGAEGLQLALSCVSEDGDQGFPGRLETTVTYTLADDGLRMEFKAVTDKRTPVTLTNHTYFNLSGYPASNCLDHVVTIPASRYLVADREQIPTGQISEVAGTALDFTAPVALGSHIDDSFEPIVIGQGYDQFFVLDDDSPAVRLAARVYEPSSGRVLEVHTDQPGVQLYSGNHMPTSLRGKLGASYPRRGGVCLEPQGYPGALNIPEFPTIVVEPDVPYKKIIAYQFPAK